MSKTFFRIPYLKKRDPYIDRTDVVLAIKQAQRHSSYRTQQKACKDCLILCMSVSGGKLQEEKFRHTVEWYSNQSLCVEHMKICHWIARINMIRNLIKTESILYEMMRAYDERSFLFKVNDFSNKAYQEWKDGDIDFLDIQLENPYSVVMFPSKMALLRFETGTHEKSPKTCTMCRMILHLRMGLEYDTSLDLLALIEWIKDILGVPLCQKTMELTVQLSNLYLQSKMISDTASSVPDITLTKLLSATGTSFLKLSK